MQKKINRALFWFVLIQPFLDIYWLYKKPLDTLLKFSIPTILRILGILVIFLMFFSIKSNRDRLRRQPLTIAYIIILLLYSIFHLWVVNNFTGLSPTSYGYSNVSEIFYLIRMTIPLVLIYVTRYTPITTKTFENIIRIVSALFSFTIVLSNIFTISLTSYHVDNAKRISANIFAWFFPNHYSFAELASKGFFFKANTVSAILFMLLTIMLYIMYKHFNAVNILLVCVQTLAMILLGTKVATYGIFVDFIAFLVFYFIHVYILRNEKKSNKFLFTSLGIVVVMGCISSFSPMFKRNADVNTLITYRSKTGHETNLNDELEKGLKKYHGKQEEKFLKDFIRKNYATYSLRKQSVLKQYSYKYDPYFWLDILREPASERINYRHLDLKMLKQVMKDNHNQYKYLFGISFIRENNIFPLEHDYLNQFFSLGIFGVIVFLGVYIWYIVFAIYSWIRYKAARTLLMSTLIISSSLLLGASMLAGNVMEYLTATIIFAFILGFMRQKLDTSKLIKNDENDSSNKLEKE